MLSLLSASQNQHSRLAWGEAAEPHNHAPRPRAPSPWPLPGCTDVAVSVVPAAANVVNGAIDVTITLGASLTGATPVVTVTPSGTCAVKAGNVYTCTGLATGQSTISASATLGGERGRRLAGWCLSTGQGRRREWGRYASPNWSISVRRKTRPGPGAVARFGRCIFAAAMCAVGTHQPHPCQTPLVGRPAVYCRSPQTARARGPWWFPPPLVSKRSSPLW
jgi:hypothetical protein